MYTSADTPDNIQASSSLQSQRNIELPAAGQEDIIKALEFRQQIKDYSNNRLKRLWDSRGEKQQSVWEWAIVFNLLRQATPQEYQELSFRELIHDQTFLQLLPDQVIEDCLDNQNLQGSTKEDPPFIPPGQDHRHKKEALIAIRSGQNAFRNELIDGYGRCCQISRCPVLAVLEAAHITPYLGELSDDPKNGLLLRVDLHRLFDKEMLGINPDTLEVALSSQIETSPYREFIGKRLIISGELEPSYRALDIAWKDFKQNQDKP